MDWEKRNKLAEEKALRILQEMEIKNYEKAKEVCRKKITNIYTPGFLFHTTNEYWAIKQLARFHKTGILPQELVKTEIERFSHSPHRISLFMYIAEQIKPFWAGPIAFLIDPAFVAENKKQFTFFTEINKVEIPWFGEPNIRSPKFQQVHRQYLQLCRKMGLNEEPNLPEGAFTFEVMSDTPIPFQAIYGGVILDKDFENRIKLFMLKLIKNHPELAFPLYDRDGNVMWPENL